MWSWLLEPCPRWVRLLHNPCSFAALVSRRRFGSRCMIPLRRDHCIRSTWSHTLLICVAKRMCSRHGRRVWRWWVGFERKGSGPLLPSRFLTDQPPFFPTKQHPHVCFQQKTSKDPISKRTCMTWSPNLAGITTTQEDRLPESRNQNTRAKIFRSSKSLMQVI
jgi:hypothetical protein